MTTAAEPRQGADDGVRRWAALAGRALVAFGAGWWVAAAVATVGVVTAATLDPTTGVPLTALPFVPLAGALVPGVVPVVLAWRAGVGTGVIRLPPECNGSTAGNCHGIGWGIAATGLVAGVALVAVAWLATPVGLALDRRYGDGPPLPRLAWAGSLVPYVGGAVGLARLSRRFGRTRSRRRARLLAVGVAVGAYLLVAVLVFVLALVRAVGAF